MPGLSHTLALSDGNAGIAHVNQPPPQFEESGGWLPKRQAPQTARREPDFQSAHDPSTSTLLQLQGHDRQLRPTILGETRHSDSVDNYSGQPHQFGLAILSESRP